MWYQVSVSHQRAVRLRIETAECEISISPNRAQQRERGSTNSPQVASKISATEVLGIALEVLCQGPGGLDHTDAPSLVPLCLRFSRMTWESHDVVAEIQGLCAQHLPRLCYRRGLRRGSTNLLNNRHRRRLRGPPSAVLGSSSPRSIALEVLNGQQ